MKIPAAFIARNLRPARVSPVRLAATIPTATADRIVATVASTPDLVSPETYLLAVAIVVRDIVDERARLARQIAREIRRAVQDTRARVVHERIRARVLAGPSWHGLQGARLESSGSIDDGRPRFVVRHALPQFEPLANADFMGDDD